MRRVDVAAPGDQLLIRRGLAALDHAAALDPAAALGGALGPYALQAAIAACHARARTAAETDRERTLLLERGAACVRLGAAAAAVTRRARWANRGSRSPVP